MNPAIFVANQLYKYFSTDELVKVGVFTAFLKDEKTSYDFGGKIAYENNHVVLFYGIPKRIEVDGENMIELLQYEHCELLADCYNLKHKKACDFGENEFKYNEQTYYNIEDVSNLLGV